MSASAARKAHRIVHVSNYVVGSHGILSSLAPPRTYGQTHDSNWPRTKTPTPYSTVGTATLRRREPLALSWAHLIYSSLVS